MRMVAAAGACLTAAWCAPAWADEPQQRDGEAINQCLRAAPADPYACIGRVQRPCQETAAGETTFGAVQCAQRETAVWTARAAADSQAIAATLSAPRLALFVAVHEAWLGYRDAFCAFEASVYLGGSLARVVAADCVLRETANRALALQQDLAEARDAR